MVSMPHSCAATSTAACTLPSAPGELAIARALQPAIRAGTASMMAVDGSGADPAGTYRPTLVIGRVMRSHTTPGIVSTMSGCDSCAA